MTYTLSRFITADPILQAMANGTIDWADTFTEEDELAWKEYNTIGEGAAILASLKAFMDSSYDSEELEEPVCTVHTVRWADEVTVTAAPIAVTPVPVRSIDDAFQVVSKAPKAQQVQAQMVQAQQVNPRGIRTIVARNLPRTITDLELRKQFGTHGAIQDIYIPKNTTPGKYFGTIKGFALIKFHTHKDSTKAFLAEKDALFLGGNAVTLEFANQDR